MSGLWQARRHIASTGSEADVMRRALKNIYELLALLSLWGVLLVWWVIGEAVIGGGL